MNSLRAAHRNGEPHEDIGGSHPLAVLRAQRLLVELADTRLSERIDEKNLLWHGKFRNHTLVAESDHMRLDILHIDGRRNLRIAHDERERPFSPACVLNSNDRAFGHSVATRDNILELERRNPLTPRLDDVLDAIG
jgi:hypothetical protein